MNFLNKLVKSSGSKGTVFIINRFLQCQSISSPLPILPKLMHVENSWIWQKNDNFELPISNSIKKIDLPNGIAWVPIPFIDPQSEKTIEAPSTVNSDIEKHAVRMIVIRRKKMKKHKLKKLRKRLRFYRAKIRQKRELKKEKEFQAMLIKQCKDAEAFSAEEYVNSRLGRLKKLVSQEDSNVQALSPTMTNRHVGAPKFK